MSDSEVRYTFRNLKIWESAQQLAADIITTLVRLPRTDAAKGIGPQLIASAGSVGANIAEGHGRYSVAAYRNHLSIARGSLAETESWLDLLKRVELLAEDKELGLRKRCGELTGGITRQMQQLEKKIRAGRSKIGEEVPDYRIDWGDELE